MRFNTGMWAALAFVSLVLFAWQPMAWQSVGLPWMTLVVTFALIPLADHALGPPSPSAAPRLRGPLVRWIPRALLPLQLGLLAWACALAPGLDAGNWLWLALAVGTVTGGLGITVAHELGHRASRLDRALARALLWSVGYGHFQVEHIRGHHVRVATPDDPASAPRGMPAHRFVWRSLVGSWRHAWALEAMRLRHLGLSPWHWRNEVLLSNSLSLTLAVGLAIAWGPWSAGLWALQALWAVLLLETVNYIEHYGLARRRGPHGWERVAPAHSWNANFALSNWLLFNLQRHSDHHAHMNKPFETLESTANAPQLPAGYPALVPLAWVAPLWFGVMDPRLQRWEQLSSTRA